MSISQPRFWYGDFHPHNAYSRDENTETLRTTFANQPQTQETRLRGAFGSLREVEDKLKLVQDVAGRTLSGHDLSEAVHWADTAMILFSDIVRGVDDIHTSNEDLAREAAEMADAMQGVAYFDSFEARMAKADHRLHELLATNAPELMGTTEPPEDGVVIDRLRELAAQEAGIPVAELLSRYYSLSTDDRAALTAERMETVFRFLGGREGARYQIFQIIDGVPQREFGIDINRTEIIRSLQDVSDLTRRMPDGPSKENVISTRIDDVARHRAQIVAKLIRIGVVAAHWHEIGGLTSVARLDVDNYLKPSAEAARELREKIDLVLRVEGIAAQLGLAIDPDVAQATAVLTTSDRDAALEAYQETVGYRMRFGVDPNSLLGADSVKVKALGASAAEHHGAVFDRLISIERGSGSVPITPQPLDRGHGEGSMGNA